MCPRTDHPGRVSVPPVYELSNSPWCVRAYSTGRHHKAHVPYLSVLKAARHLVTCCASTSTSGISHYGKSARPVELHAIRPGIGAVRSTLTHALKESVATPRARDTTRNVHRSGLR
eukprot:3241220-Prymnesium_polylepis.1